MRIGLTYDLRDEYLALGWSDHAVAEFDRIETIDLLAAALTDLGHDPDRIGGADALISRLAAGDRWDLVLNIAEGRFGTGRESLIPALLDHAEIPYTFGDPLCCALTLDKPAAKRILRDHGLPTPRFAVIASPRDLISLDIPFPVFAKPSRDGSSKGVDDRSVCRDATSLRETCDRLITEYHQPALVEEFLPGDEVTVGIVGAGPTAEVIGVLAVGLADRAAVYGYDTKERCEELVDYRLAPESAFTTEARRLALAAFRALDCRDAGRVDIRADASGAPQIIEVNALAGLHPTHSDLPIMATLAGITYTDLIGRIIGSATHRAAAASSLTNRSRCTS